MPSNDKWKAILRYTKTRQIDILGMAETCANWSKKKIQHQIRTETRHIYSHSAMYFSNNATKNKGNYLPGGTMQATVGQWSSRVQTQLHDNNKKGRWTGQQYRLTAERSLFVVTAY
jgi:hypothetical protein